MPARRARPAFSIGDVEVRAGRRKQLELPIAKLVTGTDVSLPVQVVHGRHEGPTVWINAAIHGDEINGVEIIRQVLSALDPRSLHGTVLAVPIVNVHGFLGGDRYLPDRRDLNRSFPGSTRGSLAARIAHLMMAKIVAPSDAGIDLHTGSAHRSNLPQIRANLDDEATNRMAHAFGAPILIHSRARDGSLRQAATDAGKPTLLYEGGEAWRFDDHATDVGVAGVLRTLAGLDMITGNATGPPPPPTLSRKTRWVRARQSGIAHLEVELGATVTQGELIGRIHDAFGNRRGRITATHDGVIISLTRHPLVNRGDAIIHIAEHAPQPGAAK